MSRVTLAVLGTVAAVCALAPPSLAEEMKEGEVMMVSPDGKTSTMTVDKSKAEMMIKSAQEMNEDMAVLVWGHKIYVIHDKKMDNGKMMFDFWGLHGER